MHNQNLKSDPKDALTITDLAAQGHYVSFPFLEQVYADLRYLVSLRERLTRLRNGTITRLKDILQVVWPEFERRFPSFRKKTPIAVLAAFPGPDAFLSAPRRRVLSVLKRASRGHLGEATYDELAASARSTVALPGAQGVLKDEIALQLVLLAAYERQIEETERLMAERLKDAPEGEALLSVPKLGPVTAAVFLGSIGDPRAYDSSRQALRIGGLSLVTRTASGGNPGKPRISKRGRPELRRQMHLFAVRSVTANGIFRSRYEALLRRNGGRKMPALTELSRLATRLLFRVAAERRLYTPEPPK